MLSVTECDDNELREGTSLLARELNSDDPLPDFTDSFGERISLCHSQPYESRPEEEKGDDFCGCCGKV